MDNKDFLGDESEYLGEISDIENIVEKIGEDNILFLEKKLMESKKN
ncbi:MAG: hypothetical protein GX905_03030 [Bacteroidales bacterium]|nr:hypothetical protein [Bacteroidales bacterium]